MQQEANLVDQPKLWTRDFTLICLATFFIFCAFQILMPVLPKYVQSLGADEKIVGLVSGIFTISALLARPFIGRELDRGGRRKLYQVGLSIFSCRIRLLMGTNHYYPYGFSLNSWSRLGWSINCRWNHCC